MWQPPYFNLHATGGINGGENCMCGRQLHAKFACGGGHNTAKPPVFCHDAGITNI